MVVILTPIVLMVLGIPGFFLQNTTWEIWISNLSKFEVSSWRMIIPVDGSVAIGSPPFRNHGVRPFGRGPTWRIIPVSKWLITMVSCCPLRIGLWDPFQMAFSWLINGGDPNHLLIGMILQAQPDPNWDDPPSWDYGQLSETQLESKRKQHRS